MNDAIPWYGRPIRSESRIQPSVKAFSAPEGGRAIALTVTREYFNASATHASKTDYDDKKSKESKESKESKKSKKKKRKKVFSDEKVRQLENRETSDDSDSGPCWYVASRFLTLMNHN